MRFVFSSRTSFFSGEFQGDNLLEILQKIPTEEPPAVRTLNPQVERDLATICHKCLQKESDQRYASAAALADDLGMIQIHLGRFGESEQSWEHALELREQLVRDHPRLLRYQADLAGMYEDLGHARWMKKERAEAVLLFQKARILWERMQKNDPRTPDLRFRMARCDYWLGQLYGYMKEPELQFQHLEQSRTALAALVQQVPDLPEYRHRLGGTLHGLALAYQQQDKFQQALPFIRQAIDQQHKAFTAAPQLAQYRSQLSDQYRTLLQLLVDTGQIDTALAPIQQRRKWWHNHPDGLYNLARDVAFAPLLSPLTPEQQNHWNKLALELLQQAVAAGFDNGKRLESDTAFRGLRDQEEFQELLSRCRRAGRPQVPTQ